MESEAGNKGEQVQSGGRHWSEQPLHDSMEKLDHLDRLLHLTMSAIARVRNSPAAVEAHIKFHDFLDRYEPQIARSEQSVSREEMRRNAKIEAEIAEDEVTHDFPLLHEQAVVSLWGCTENMVKSFLVSWLRNQQSAFSVPQIQKLKVPLGEYDALEQEERCFYIVEMLDRELNAPLKQGITRFQSLLEPFGLDATIDSTIARDLYELSQVRNLLVHRAAIVDRRFQKACPWIQLNLGDKCSVSHENFGKYYVAVVEYHIALLKKVRSRLAQETGGSEGKAR